MKARANPIVKALMLHFADLWRKRFGSSYPITWQRNLPQIARLLKTYEVEEIERFMTHYLTGFFSTFAEKTGYSFGGFITLLAEVIVSEKDAREKRAKGAQGAADFDRLEAARLAGENE